MPTAVTTVRIADWPVTNGALARRPLGSHQVRGGSAWSPWWAINAFPPPVYCSPCRTVDERY